MLNVIEYNLKDFTASDWCYLVATVSCAILLMFLIVYAAKHLRGVR